MAELTRPDGDTRPNIWGKNETGKPVETMTRTHCLAGRQGRLASRFLVLVTIALASPADATQSDVLTAMRQWGQFQVFCRLVNLAGLETRLSGPGPVTVFAPTDAAFERLGQAALERLEATANRTELRTLLLYHLAPERISVFELRREAPRATAHGKTITSLMMSGAMMVNDAFIDIEDIPASNGLVHGIDKVLTPPD